MACSTFSAAVITATPSSPATAPRPAADSNAPPRPTSLLATTAVLSVGGCVLIAPDEPDYPRTGRRGHRIPVTGGPAVTTPWAAPRPVPPGSQQAARGTRTGP